MDQAQYFQQMISPISSVIVLECSEDVLIERLLPRGRFDDNAGNIHRRLNTFKETTSIVIDHFDREDKVHVINAEGSVQAVYDQLIQVVGAFAKRRNVHT